MQEGCREQPLPMKRCKSGIHSIHSTVELHSNLIHFDLDLHRITDPLKIKNSIDYQSNIQKWVV